MAFAILGSTGGGTEMSTLTTTRNGQGITILNGSEVDEVVR